VCSILIILWHRPTPQQPLRHSLALPQRAMFRLHQASWLPKQLRVPTQASAGAAALARETGAIGLGMLFGAGGMALLMA
jgi:hypothetical protein